VPGRTGQNVTLDSENDREVVSVHRRSAEDFNVKVRYVAGTSVKVKREISHYLIHSGHN